MTCFRLIKVVHEFIEHPSIIHCGTTFHTVTYDLVIDLCYLMMVAFLRALLSFVNAAPFEIILLSEMLYM